MLKSVLRLFVALVALVSSSCLLVPVRTSGTLGNVDLASPDSHFIEIDGLHVHYRYVPYSGTESGDRPLIVLLHGFGASLFSWREVAEPLAAYGNVVAYDRPAFGLTERPLKWKGRNPYASESQVDLVVGLMDALGAKQAVLVGNSAGGTIALQTALAHPQRVAALVLVSPAVYGGGGAPGWIKPLFWLPGVNHIGPLIAGRLGAEGDDFIRSAWYDDKAMGPEVLPGYRAPLAIKNWENALWELTKASSSSNLAERLRSITMPALVITGDTDRIVPPEQSQRLASELPDATLVIIPRSGHLAHEETPEEFMSAFDVFWNKQIIELY